MYNVWMQRFEGRAADLALLRAQLDDVGRTKTGVMLALCGRRQVGKSRLVEEFCQRAGVPYLQFVAARRQTPTDSLAEFARNLGESNLPTASLAEDGFGSWRQALTSATSDLSSPVIVVLDEFPWLVESVPDLEGVLQNVWDRLLSRRPVLMVLVGSDVTMMDALTTYGRPLYDRARPMPIAPLDPIAVQRLTELGPADTIEAMAITGGFPNVVLRWRAGESPASFLRRELQNPLSSLVVSGERSIAAEFPESAYARPVLDAIGYGEREHTAIAERAGLKGSSLERALSQLLEKGVIVRERAYSTVPAKSTRYRVADAYLRFWLRYVGRNLPLIERGAGKAVSERVVADWQRWVGVAVEPLVRESVFRLLLQEDSVDQGGAGGVQIGRWWRRDGSAEVHIVVGDRGPVAQQIRAIGSIKWKRIEPFDLEDAASLLSARALVPGATPTTKLIVASRTPVSVPGIDSVFGPTELMSAWQT